MAPAARSCTAPGAGEQSEELVCQVCGRDAGQLSVVVGGCHLDDLGADKVESLESAQQLQQFAACQAADLRCSRPWRMRGVEHVDVDRHVERVIADRLSQLGDDV